ncbi:MAG: PQQ-binding-like beta-propeller repeat protein, partial [Anaerolineaceae bacterium]|nr:PQQ-binding-like beta-propeller repeat protein [Anaerolineaceae bacterium]
PVWTRRLAELCRQGNDFSKAELLLQLAADQAGQLGDLERRRDQKLATNRRLARLYKQWGRHLLDGGKPAEAVSKLEAAVRHSTGQAAGVRTLMTLARYYESQGDKLQASSCYARVADREAAERFFLPADSDGLEQTPATQARLALRRLSARRKTSPAGLGREWIKRLSLRRIGMLTWSTPSQVAVDSGEPFTPLVWVRTDGLVGLGPAGEIRWRRSKPPEAGDSPAMPLLSKGLAYQSHDWGLVAYRLNSGRRAWTWSVPKGRITASGARAGRLLPRRNFQRIVRINGNRLLIRESVAGEAASSAIAFTDRVTVVGTYDQRGDAPQLHGLDPATGRQKWKLELPQNTVVTHLAAEGGKVVAAMQKRRGPVELRCIDADSGQQLWQAKAEIPLAMSTRGLFMMNGVVVLLDFAKGCRVISGESGKTLWQADLGQNGWPGAAPIYADRERTVLRFDRGCVAVSNSTGKAIWQIGSASAAGEALIVRSAISSATWTEALAFGDRIVTWRRGDTEDLIVAYRIKDGQVAWQHEAGGRSQNGYGLTVCRDMLIYHEVGEIGFRRALGDATKERRLKFLDLAGGKLLGEIFLGAGPAISMGQPPLEVHLTPGGLYVQNGNEMLSVRPSAGAGAATGLSSPPAVGGKI